MMLCEAKLCTGCSACRNVCPRDAITMCEDHHGVLLPSVDRNKCINCGLCAKICPILHPVQIGSEPRCLVAWSNDAVLRKTAASAGVVSALSQRILRDGGVVFGTRYHEGQLIFDFIENEERIREFQGSKYVHANAGMAYLQVKEFLEQGRPVLFPGTPCQISGLKNYLGREYDNLLTVDLICHGVTTGKYLEDYLRQRRKGLLYDSVLFRGEQGQKMVVFHEGKAVWAEEKLLSPFYMAYAKGLIHRENCYSCPFASVSRCSDLTAGDFWGIDRNTLPPEAIPVSHPSLVLVNTQKGWESLSRAGISFEERTVEEALSGNNQLSTPCVRHPNKDVFLRHYHNSGFYGALRKTPFYRKIQLQATMHRIRCLLSRVKHAIIK